MTLARPADRGWNPLLICLAGYIATSVGRVHQLFPFLLPLKPAFLTAAGAIGLLMLQRGAGRRIRELKMPASWYLLILLFCVAMSVPFAVYPGLAFSLLISSFLKTVLLFFVIVASIRGPRDVERLALVYFASAAVYAAVVLSQFQVAEGGSGWRLGGLFYYDANDFATFAVSAFPLGLYFGFGQPRWSSRIIGVLGLIVLSIAFVWSGSRGGFMALIAVALFVLFGYRTLPVSWRAGGIIAVALALFVTAGPTYWKQMRSILKPDQDYNKTEDTGRWKIWKRGVTYMVHNPVLGVGAGCFPVAEGILSPLADRQNYGIGVRWNAAHNTFVQVGAELGVPGLVLLLLLIGNGFRSLYRVARVQIDAPNRERGPPRLTQALIGSLIGFVVGAIFLSLAYGDMLYALLALAAGLRKVTLPESRRRTRQRQAAAQLWTAPPLGGGGNIPQWGKGTAN